MIYCFNIFSVCAKLTKQNESTRRFEESKKNVEDEVAQSGSELEN